MTPNLPNDAPELLSEFVKFYEEENSILCNVPPEEFARCFRIHFEIPFPMGMPDASIMVQNMEDIKFYIQPGLENKLNIRGFWISKGSSHIILVDAERPDPSKIKTVIHELSEQILTISHNLHPEILKRSDKSREQFVNAVAAHVKMPSEKFRKQIECFGLDVEQLTQANNDTLAGVARHIRDLVMSQRPFYFARFDIVRSPKITCPKIAPLAEDLSAKCIRVVDVVRSSAINTDRIKGGLPTYNLPTFDHFRMLNPIMNCFIANRAAVFFSLLEGCSSNNSTCPDLFGDQQICVLLKPYGKGKTTGFWMLAVHPKDRHLIEFALERIQPEFRSELNWLFSWETETGKRFYHSNLQLGLPSLDDNPPFQGSFNEEAYRWPLPGDVPPID